MDRANWQLQRAAMASGFSREQRPIPASQQVLAGTLKFDVTSGPPIIAAGLTATVASGATLELAGPDSALGAAGVNRVDIVNDRTPSSLIVSVTSQVAGGINGRGSVQFNAGGDLTADHIIHDKLLIAGTSLNPGRVTIDAGDPLGKPLGNVAAVANSSRSDAPPRADVIGGTLIGDELSGDPLAAISTTSNSSENAELDTVPGPRQIIQAADFESFAISTCAFAQVELRFCESRVNRVLRMVD
jgi:hypothetical protein